MKSNANEHKNTNPEKEKKKEHNQRNELPIFFPLLIFWFCFSLNPNLFSVFSFSLRLIKMVERTNRFKATGELTNQQQLSTTIKQNG